MTDTKATPKGGNRGPAQRSTDIVAGHDRRLKAARWLAKQGFHVFPLDHPSLPKCAGAHSERNPCDGKRGKHPTVHWPTKATTDLDQIEIWFGPVRPARNIGVACKKSDLLVIDEDKLGELARLAADLGKAVPETFKVKTGKGFHYWLRPNGLALGNKKGIFGDYSCDIRGPGGPDNDGGYVAGPGSDHASGAVYERVKPVLPLVDIPDWLTKAIGTPRKRKDGQSDGDPFADNYVWWRDDEIIHHPQRHEALMAVAGWARGAGIPWKQATHLFRETWDRLCNGTCCPDAGYVSNFDVALESKLRDAYERWSPESDEPESTFSEGSPPEVGAKQDGKGVWHFQPTGISLGEWREVGGQVCWTDPVTEQIYDHETWDPNKESWSEFSEFRNTPDLIVTSADQITMEATDWLWAGSDLEDPFDEHKELWLPCGELALLAGREATGKSSWAFWIAAQVTAGTLPGAFEGEARYVVVVATEDHWAKTIAPRMAVAGAKLERVLRVEAADYGGITLPADIKGLKRVCVDHKVAMVIIDPLLGVLDAKINSHVDAEIRQALIPLAQLAHDIDATILGLAHVNKGSGGDLMTKIMASRALTAVPRSVLFAARDTSGEGAGFLLGQLKNSLGGVTRVTITYSMESKEAGYDERRGKAVISSAVIETGRLPKSIEDVIAEQEKPADKDRPIDRAAAWLTGILDSGEMSRPDVLAQADRDGHAEATVKRAFAMLNGISRQPGRVAIWRLPTTEIDPGDPDDLTDLGDPGDPGS